MEIEPRRIHSHPKSWMDTWQGRRFVLGKRFPIMGMGRLQLDLYLAEVKARRRASIALSIVVITAFVALCVIGILASK